MKYKIYDISQELIHSSIYPGDPSPKLELIRNIQNGDLYNLSNLQICVHNGTHIDAPKHFIKDGKSVEKIGLFKFIGYAYVYTFNGQITKDIAERIMQQLIKIAPNAYQKLLLKGQAIITTEGAQVFAEYNIDLIGTELLSVGDENSVAAVHQALLSKDIVILEGLKLNFVDDGIFFLNAAPLAIAEAEGAPCRAILIKWEY